MKYSKDSLITFNGTTRRLYAWAETSNINWQTLKYRLNNNWPVKNAFSGEKPFRISDISLTISEETERKILAEYNQRQPKKMPASQSWPSLGKDTFQKVRKQDLYDQNFKFLIAAERKKRWLYFKKLLGEEYLNELRKQCYYMVAD